MEWGAIGAIIAVCSLGILISLKCLTEKLDNIFVLLDSIDRTLKELNAKTKEVPPRSVV